MFGCAKHCIFPGTKDNTGIWTFSGTRKAFLVFQHKNIIRGPESREVGDHASTSQCCSNLCYGWHSINIIDTKGMDVQLETRPWWREPSSRRSGGLVPPCKCVSDHFFCVLSVCLLYSSGSWFTVPSFLLAMNTRIHEEASSLVRFPSGMTSVI
jgi:hypothetical protein